VTFNGGLLLVRELDERLGLTGHISVIIGIVIVVATLPVIRIRQPVSHEGVPHEKAST
jgi:hypothetical protein